MELRQSLDRRDGHGWCASAALWLALAAVGCSSAVRPAPASAAACTFTNPVARGADPWIVRDGGHYYYVQSRNDAIWVYRSDRLTSPERDGVRVWSAPDSGWNHTNVWAPELHHIDGRWYIYYAAGRSGPPFLHQRAGVLQSSGDDPRGPYADRGALYTGDDVAADTGSRWAIDLTVHEIGGRRYAVWSGWERPALTDRTPQHLYIARMRNAWTIATNRVRLASPDESWELGPELNLEEGPEFLDHAGQTFIIYSTRESWLRHYRLGQLRLTSPDADPMDPSHFVKSGPVFQATDAVYGVGHASFTTSPDGREDWIVYHAKVDSTPGWKRAVRMQKFTWKPDGSPDFGTPVPSGARIPEPSGECVVGAP